MLGKDACTGEGRGTRWGLGRVFLQGAQGGPALAKPMQQLFRHPGEAPHPSQGLETCIALGVQPFIAGEQASHTTAPVPQPSHLEEPVEGNEYAHHGQVLGVDEVQRLGHGDEHLVVHPLRHTLRQWARGWEAQR